MTVGLEVGMTLHSPLSDLHSQETRVVVYIGQVECDHLQQSKRNYLPKEIQIPSEDHILIFFSKPST